jgi:hypothetical protein
MEEVEQHGVKVFIEPKALMFVLGTKVRTTHHRARRKRWTAAPLPQRLPLLCPPAPLLHFLVTPASSLATGSYLGHHRWTSWMIGCGPSLSFSTRTRKVRCTHKWSDQLSAPPPHLTGSELSPPPPRNPTPVRQKPEIPSPLRARSLARVLSTCPFVAVGQGSVAVANPSTCDQMNVNSQGCVHLIYAVAPPGR